MQNTLFSFKSSLFITFLYQCAKEYIYIREKKVQNVQPNSNRYDTKRDFTS